MVFRHMNRRLATAAVVGSVFAAGLLAPRSANAQSTITTLFSSGVTNAGASDTFGATDLHYALISAPILFGGNPSVANPAPLYVSTKGNYAGRGNWIDDGVGNGVSRWLTPGSADASTHAVGTYTYRTTFDLSGFTASSAVLNLQMAVDDSVTVRVNGAAVTGASGNSPSTFSSATINSSNATFVSGLNTLDFVVVNGAGLTGNPVGLRVQASGTAISASAAPEPGALSLMAVGLVSAGGGSFVVRKRRAKKA